MARVVGLFQRIGTSRLQGCLSTRTAKFVNPREASMSTGGKLRGLSSSLSPDNRLVWVDCEMTGLNIETDTLLEIAVIITEGDTLEEVGRTDSIIIKTDKKVLDNMDEWCQVQHGKSGLTKACLESQVTMTEAEDQVMKLLTELAPPGKCLLAGNSVGQDLKFIDKYMPRISEHLHYRIVDVSTVKELCRRWLPEKFQEAPKKAMGHRALDDIEESIKELKYYKEKVFMV